MKNIKHIFIILIILSVSFSSVGQTNDEKTTFIISKLKLVKMQRLQIIDFNLKPLKYQAYGKDSIRLDEIEAQYTDEEILKRISIAFDNTFTPEEINSLYDFFQTTAFEKLFNSVQIYDVISSEFESVNKELEEIKNNIENAKPSSLDLQYIRDERKKFEPIPTDKKDGFYKTINYSSVVEYEDIELGENPSITIKDIKKVYKAYSTYNNKIEISIEFTKEGAKKFYLLTKESIGSPIAIIIANKIVSMPTVQSEILGGKASITGNFTEKEFDEMILRLKGK